MRDPAQAGQRPSICPMTHASARAAPLVVMTQHPNFRPIKGHGSADGVNGMRNSQQPTLRKTSRPASRDARALTPLGHVGGSPARDQRVAERADEASSHPRPWMADDPRQRFSRGSYGDAPATRQRRIQRHPLPLPATPKHSWQHPPPENEGIGQMTEARRHRTTPHEDTEVSSSALMYAVPRGSGRQLPGPLSSGLLSRAHHPSSCT